MDGPNSERNHCDKAIGFVMHDSNLARVRYKSKYVSYNSAER